MIATYMYIDTLPFCTPDNVKCLKEFCQFKSATPNDNAAKLAKLLTLSKIELHKYNGDRHNSLSHIYGSIPEKHSQFGH